MTDPYVSIDTFSVGSEPTGGGDDATSPAPATRADAPILARLPRVRPSRPEPAKTRRYDSAEAPLHGTHAEEASTTAGGADYVGGLPTGAVTAPLIADPTTTLRIDTVTPNAFDTAPVETRPASPLAAPEALANETIDDPWAAWLLEAESTVLPYTRWIVLAAVIAALGLTLVLLQTAGRPPADAGGAAPQVSIGATDHAIAEVATPSAPTDGDSVAPAWEPDAGLIPLGTGAETTAAPPLVAAGPASAAPRGGAAALLGEVLPSAPALATAERTDYPRTAAAPRESSRGSVSR